MDEDFTEPTKSQLEAMGIQWLRAHTNTGFDLKVHASLLAPTLINAREQSPYPISKDLDFILNC